MHAGGAQATKAAAKTVSNLVHRYHALLDCVQLLAEFGRVLEYKSQAAVELMKDAVDEQVWGSWYPDNAFSVAIQMSLK
jgi:hypothetical protein